MWVQNTLEGQAVWAKDSLTNGGRDVEKPSENYIGSKRTAFCKGFGTEVKRRHCEDCCLSTWPWLSDKGIIHWGKEAVEDNHITGGRTWVWS